MIELLEEINSQNPNSILDKIIAESKIFEELDNDLKMIKSIIDYCDDAKSFLFNLGSASFKKVLGYFKEEQEEEKEKKKKNKKINSNLFGIL